MENNNGDSKSFGRRRTLQIFGVGLAVGGGLLSLEACKNNNSSPSGGDAPKGTGGGGMDCTTAVDDTSKQLRKTLQYKKEALVPEKHCSACAQYTAGQYGDCGGCKLFTGPVQPNGGCLSFAPKGAEGGTPAPGATPG